MSTTAPVPPATPAAYRDRKRLLWLLSVLGPTAVAIGPVAHTLGATSQAWFFVALVTLYVAVPIMDFVLGEDLSNPPESAVPQLEADRYYRWINYAVVPVLWAPIWMR